MVVCDDGGQVIGQVETVGGRWHAFVRHARTGLTRVSASAPLTRDEAVQVVQACHAELDRLVREGRL